MNDSLLAAALQQISDAETVIQPGSPEFNAVGGGPQFVCCGQPAWPYYQMVVSIAPPRSGGTTCSTFLAYWMSVAGGWPADMIDRKPTDADAPGGGFVPGLSLSKIIAGAKKRGWYHDAQAGDVGLQPGDIYHVDHPAHPNSDHVGIVREVRDPGPDGTREIGTIDGGQGSGADARWQTRILSADGKTIALDGIAARLLGVVRADG